MILYRLLHQTGVGANGETYNINADSVAGEIAGALKAEKLLVLTDVKGIYADYRDEASFISTLSFEKAQELIIRGNIDGGMIPKVKGLHHGAFRRCEKNAYY